MTTPIEWYTVCTRIGTCNECPRRDSSCVPCLNESRWQLKLSSAVRGSKRWTGVGIDDYLRWLDSSSQDWSCWNSRGCFGGGVCKLASLDQFYKKLTTERSRISFLVFLLFTLSFHLVLYSLLRIAIASIALSWDRCLHFSRILRFVRSSGT